MKVHPLYDRVLLKRLEEQEVKRGGIIIPDTANGLGQGEAPGSRDHRGRKRADH